MDQQRGPRWTVKTKQISVVVRAPNQFRAFDVLRDRDALDFGLVVTARREGTSEGDEYAVRTSALMLAWGRAIDAALFRRAAIEAGLPDTLKQDTEAAGRIRRGGV